MYFEIEFMLKRGVNFLASLHLLFIAVSFVDKWNCKVGAKERLRV